MQQCLWFERRSEVSTSENRADTELRESSRCVFVLMGIILIVIYTKYIMLHSYLYAPAFRRDVNSQADGEQTVSWP